MFSRLVLALALILAVGFTLGCSSGSSQNDGPITPKVADAPPKDSSKLKPVGVGAGGGGPQKQPPKTSTQ
jgi:hypothetical protein